MSVQLDGRVKKVVFFFKEKGWGREGGKEETNSCDAARCGCCDRRIGGGEKRCLGREGLEWW